MARLLGLGRNPLRRRSDRIETRARVAVLATVVAAAVMTVQAATADYLARERAAVEQASTRYQVSAVLLKDAPEPISLGTEYSTAQAYVAARWADADGVEHEGRLAVDAGAKAGQSKRIWLDAQGELTSEPGAGLGALLGALVAGATPAAGLVLVALIAFWSLRRRLDRARLQQWEDGWAKVGPQWTKKTG